MLLFFHVTTPETSWLEPKDENVRMSKNNLVGVLFLFRVSYLVYVFFCKRIQASFFIQLVPPFFHFFICSKMLPFADGRTTAMSHARLHSNISHGLIWEPGVVSSNKPTDATDPRIINLKAPCVTVSVRSKRSSWSPNIVLVHVIVSYCIHIYRRTGTENAFMVSKKTQNVAT